MASYGYEELSVPHGVPGGYLNASLELYGPGSTAYDAYGPYSSYAYESNRGGIYQHNVTNHFGDTGASYYNSLTRYSYSNSEYSTTSFHQSIYNQDPGYSSRTAYQATSTYSLSGETIRSQDGIQEIHQYTSNTYNYANGTYTRFDSEDMYDDGPHGYIQGSSSNTSSTTYGYVGGYNGYYSYAT